MTYIYDGAAGPVEIEPRTAELLEFSRGQIRFRGFDVFCSDCFGDETCCRNQPKPRPSLWRRLLRKEH
jgi:hypothetical protein